MTTFWIAIFGLLLLALLVVWYSFYSTKESETESDIRKETNISLYHEHLQELDSDLAEGTIDQESYEQLKSELDKTLLQDVASENNEPVKKSAGLSVIWPISVSVFVGLLGFYMYFQIGASDLIEQPAVAASSDNPHANLDPQQMALFRLQQLEQKVETEPTNSQAWFSLGQAYISNGLFDEAVAAFDKVIELVGEHAELIGPKAQALYYKNNQHMNAEVLALVDKALELDPSDASTNILLGMDKYAHNEFEKAIHHWQIVLDSGRPGINIPALTGAIEEAKNQLKIAEEMASAGDITPDVNASEPRLIIDLDFSQEILNMLMQGEDKTVFVYATATQGPRMPLAAVKIQASDIPTRIALDNSTAMTAMNLSSTQRVNLYAVVSMSGSVGIKNGDYIAELKDVDVMHKDVINLTISTVVNN